MPIYIVNNGNLFTYRIFAGQIVPLNRFSASGLLLDQETAMSAAVVLKVLFYVRFPRKSCIFLLENLGGSKIMPFFATPISRNCTFLYRFYS